MEFYKNLIYSLELALDRFIRMDFDKISPNNKPLGRKAISIMSNLIERIYDVSIRSDRDFSLHVLHLIEMAKDEMEIIKKKLENGSGESPWLNYTGNYDQLSGNVLYLNFHGRNHTAWINHTYFDNSHAVTWHSYSQKFGHLEFSLQ